MRILITGDLHYNIRRSQAGAVELAAEARRLGGDALVLLGDTAGADTQSLREALELFAEFDGLRLLVPGNHCLWCQPGQDSLQRYHELLPALAGECGFVLLDASPQVLDGVGLVGSVGWYDYSFREEALDVPKDFYEAKIAPGAARYYGGHEDLLARHAERLTDRHHSLSARWMDGVHVKLPYSDAEFVAVLADRLAGQLAELAPRVDRIVAFMHHLPFEQLVPRNRPDRFAFAAAYMGSERFGEVLLDCPKVTHVYCAHSHWKTRARIGRIEAVNVGSTYVQKHLEVLEI